MSEAQIGDTFHLASEKVEPLEGFAPTVPMVYAGIFPIETTDFLKLEEAIQRLALNDRSVTVQRESSMALVRDVDWASSGFASRCLPSKARRRSMATLS